MSAMPALSPMTIQPPPPGVDGRDVIHLGRMFPLKAQINPLRGLTIARAVTLLEQSEYGYFSDLTWLYRFVERGEAVMRGLKYHRQSALGAAEWSIEYTQQVLDNPGLEPQAKVQQSYLREVFGRIDNLRAAWKWLGMATFRGFAHLEMHFDPAWNVFHLEPVDQWYFNQRYPHRTWLYNPSGQNTQSGTAVIVDGPESTFIVREVEDPIDWVAVGLFIYKQLAFKDWATFCSVFGVPSIFATMDKDSRPAPNELAHIMAKLEAYVSNGRGVLPPGVDLKTFSGGSGEGQPMPQMLDYVDKMLVLAGTSGKLTMLSDPTGIGSGATDAHQEAFNSLAEDELREISEILQTSIGNAALRTRFPGQPILAQLAIRRPAQNNPKEAADLMWKAKLGGYLIQQPEAEKMLGTKLEKMPTEELMAGGNGALAMNRSVTRVVAADMEESINRVADAVRDDFETVVNRLMQAVDIEDPEERNAALTEMADEMPAILEKLNKDPRAAKLMHELMATAMAEGLTG